MMLATPMRNRAWSSTSSTLFLAGALASAPASAGDMQLGRPRDRCPREYDFGAVPRRGHDGERGADAVGALLHAGQPESRRGSLLRHAAAIIRHRQPEADGLDRRGPNHDAPGVRVTHGIRQRFL